MEIHMMLDAEIKLQLISFFHITARPPDLPTLSTISLYHIDIYSRKWKTVRHSSSAPPRNLAETRRKTLEFDPRYYICILVVGETKYERWQSTKGNKDRSHNSTDCIAFPDIWFMNMQVYFNDAVLSTSQGVNG